MVKFGRRMRRNAMRSTSGAQRRMTRDHLGLLRGIEKTFVDAHRRSADVDDRACHAAVEVALALRTTDDPRVTDLADRLAEVRHKRCWESDATWQDALRVVATSIRNHSERRPGEKGYLSFVSVFLPKGR